MKERVPGSLLGGVLLIAGSCIGAGMLALPIVTGLSGFFPSLLVLFAAWGFMTFTGLLLIETSGWFYGETNLMTLAEEALGRVGRFVCWISYVFLFYSLLVAYVAASGSIFASISQELFHVTLSATGGSIFFTVLFGVIVYLGTAPVDWINRVLMVGLIATYMGLVGVGVFHIQPRLLTHVKISSILTALPVLVISFGFQNVVPSLVQYMRGDLVRVKKAVLGGGLLTLLIYLVWSIVVLGVVPFEGHHGILESYEQGQQASQALKAILGSSRITLFAQGFAFFAIVTSFLAQGLTLTHFLADAFRIASTSIRGRLLTILALFPPLIMALIKPEIFFQALNVAGGLFAMILFGILPIAMVWVGRYRQKRSSNYHVLGGKRALWGGFVFSLLVIVAHFLGL
jgi:tyrosine-specific transport protein